MRRMKPRKKGSLTGTVFRLLGKNRGSRELTSGQEEIVHARVPGDNCYNYWKEVETTWLEAERKKAEALMEWQKSRFIC